MAESPKTTSICNVSPLGALDVPLIGRVVAAGEIVDVPTEHADRLLEQEANWARAGSATEEVDDDHAA